MKKGFWVKQQGKDGLIFGERLKDLIFNSKKTAKEISRETGISESALSDYQKENRNRVPDSDTFKILANYFGVTYDYLYGDVRASKRSNLAASECFGFSDKTASLLKNLNAKGDSSAEMQLSKMQNLFNAMVENGLFDILQDILLFEDNMGIFAKDCTTDEMQSVAAIVGNRYKNRMPGTAITSQTDFYDFKIQQLERKFGELIKTIVNHP